MISAEQHPQEADRVASLRALNILDTKADQGFDALTELASSVSASKP